MLDTPVRQTSHDLPSSSSSIPPILRCPDSIRHKIFVLCGLQVSKQIVLSSTSWDDHGHVCEQACKSCGPRGDNFSLMRALTLTCKTFHQDTVKLFYEENYFFRRISTVRAIKSFSRSPAFLFTRLHHLTLQVRNSSCAYGVGCRHQIETLRHPRRPLEQLGNPLDIANAHDQVWMSSLLVSH